MDGITQDAAVAAAMVEQAMSGDRIAFARIVAAYHADLTRVAFVVSGGRQDLADDAVQAAWTIAWRKLGSLRDPRRLRAWLVAVAANEARQAYREQRSGVVAEIDLDEAASRQAEPSEPDPADRAGALDLERALAHLSVGDRTLLALRYEAGLDSREIATAIGRPAATVRWRLARLRERLRKELSDA